MANKYWYKTGADANWATVTGNWWDDAAHTQQSSGVPATNDSLFILGSIPPATGPSSAITLGAFDTRGLNSSSNLSSTVTQNISIAANGSLQVGNNDATLSGLHYWRGTATATGIDIDFWKNGVLSGVIGDDANFHANSTTEQTSGQLPTIGANANFYDTSRVQGAASVEAGFHLVGDNATFHDTSWNQGVKCSGTVTCLDSSTLESGRFNNVIWRSTGALSYYQDLTIVDGMIYAYKDVHPTSGCISGEGRVLLMRREVTSSIALKTSAAQAYGFGGNEL